MSAIPRRFAATCALRSLRQSASLQRPGRAVSGFVSNSTRCLRSSIRPRVDELERLDRRALVRDRSRERGHRPRGDPADIRVVPARGDEKDNLAVAEHRGDHGDVWQVLPPATGWLVTNTSPGAQALSTGPAPLELPAYGAAHRAEVHGDVRGVRDKPPSGPKSAHEKSRRSLMFVETLVLQSAAHLLGDAHEPVVEIDGQRDRIGRRRENGADSLRGIRPSFVPPAVLRRRLRRS